MTKNTTRFVIFLNVLALLCLSIFVVKSIDPVQLQRIVDEEESHRRLSTQETGSIITGKKVLFAVASYGTSQFLFLQDMLESIRDLCEYGTSVSVVIYSTLPFTPSTLNLLNSRLQCRNPNGNIDAKVIIAGAQLKEHFVDAHRKYFYDHLDDYDLFVYTEDDQNLRPSHFISYLEETQKLKKVVGPEVRHIPHTTYHILYTVLAQIFIFRLHFPFSFVKVMCNVIFVLFLKSILFFLSGKLALAK